MKVILLKDCKDGKANTIIDVTPGYGTNYLIRNGYAMSHNPANLKKLEKILDNLEAKEHENILHARQLEEEISKITLNYELEATIDSHGNLNVYKSVSTKHIKKDLSDLGIKLPDFAIQKVHLVSEGSHIIKINLYKDIYANLDVKVKINVIK